MKQKPKMKFATKNCKKCRFWQKTFADEQELCSHHEVYNPRYLVKKIKDEKKYLRNTITLFSLFVIIMFVALVHCLYYNLLLMALIPSLTLLWTSLGLAMVIVESNRCIKELTRQRNEFNALP